MFSLRALVLALALLALFSAPLAADTLNVSSVDADGRVAINRIIIDDETHHATVIEGTRYDGSVYVRQLSTLPTESLDHLRGARLRHYSRRGLWYIVFIDHDGSISGLGRYGGKNYSPEHFAYSVAGTQNAGNDASETLPEHR